jgi:putative oxidoreductase
MLSTFLAPHTERAYAFMRIMAGLMFAFHGLQKIVGVFATTRPDIGTQMWSGGLIELICGTAVAAGAFTPWAAFLASGTMAVAYFQFHWKFQLGPDFFPIVNKGELAALYSVVFLFIACRGPGHVSVDRALEKK